MNEGRGIKAISHHFKEKYLYPCYVVDVPVNRKHKRHVKEELLRNMPKLDEIEKNFLDDLFDEGFQSYNTLYEKYSKKYMDMIMWMVRNKKFNLTIPNKLYFSYLYAPVETKDLRSPKPFSIQRIFTK